MIRLHQHVVPLLHREETTLTFVVLNDNSTDDESNIHSDKKFISGEVIVNATTINPITGSPKSAVSVISKHPVTRIYKDVAIPEEVSEDDSSWTDGAVGPAVAALLGVGGLGLLAGVGATAAKLISERQNPNLGG